MRSMLTAISLCCCATSLLGQSSQRDQRELLEVRWDKPGPYSVISLTPGLKIIPADPPKTPFAAVEVAADSLDESGSIRLLKLTLQGSATPTQPATSRPAEAGVAITKPIYALSGQVKYQDIAGQGVLEMWSLWSDGLAGFFSRSLAQSGPLKSLEGSSDWRGFLLPFYLSGKGPPQRITLSLHLPKGSGKVWLGPVKLMQYDLDQDPLASWKLTEAELDVSGTQRRLMMMANEMVDRDPTYRQLEYQKSQLETQRDELNRRGLTEKHPQVREVRDSLATVKAQVDKRRVEIVQQVLDRLGVDPRLALLAQEAVDRDGVYRGLQHEKSQLEMRLDELTRKLGPNHLDVKQVRDRLMTAQAQADKRRAEIVQQFSGPYDGSATYPASACAPLAKAQAGISNDRWVGIGGGVLGGLIGTLAGLGGALANRRRRTSQGLFVACAAVGLVVATLAFHSYWQSGYRGYLSLCMTASGAMLMMALLMVVIRRRYRSMELKRVEAMDL